LTEIDYGAWEGLSSDEITRRWPTAYLAWTEEGKWPSLFGGSLDNHLKQIAEWIELLHSTYTPGDTVLAVSSNGLIRFFSNEWEKLSASKQIDRLKVKTGHFCELELHSHHLHIKKWNASPLIEQIQM
jgi:probable phosphoglycerate mutase